MSEHIVISAAFLFLGGLAVAFKAMPETKIFSLNEQVAFNSCNKLHDNTCVGRSLNCQPSLEDYEIEFCVASYYKIYPSGNYENVSFTCSCKNSICWDQK